MYREYRFNQKHLKNGAKAELLQTSHIQSGAKITSLNFKVNNKKTIRDTKILFLDSETTMGNFKSHSLKKNILQVVAVIVNTLL